MNYLLLTHGTDGDVYPFVGLGRALMERGHRITLMTNEHFRRQATKNGFDFVAIGSEAEFVKEFEDPDIWRSRSGFKKLGQWICRSIPDQYQAVVERYEEASTVVVTSTAAFGARIAHEKLGFPMATIMLQPGLLRSAYKMPIIAGAPAVPGWMPPFVVRSLFRPFDMIADRILRIKEVNAFRATVGLPPVKRLVKDWWLSPQRVITLFPDWFGMPQPDWPKQLRTTGFPLYDDPSKTNTLADDVLQFLDAGDPPIVFTPGTGMMHGRAFFDAAVGACRILGRRALLLTRHTEQLPPTLPDSVRYVSYVPFSELLPRTAAIVHHGGVGTLAQALAAGIPQLVMPMAYDQPDNAARLKSLGVADWLKRSAFRAPAVAQKLRYLLESQEVAARCRTLAQRVDKSRGLQQACDLIEELGDRNTRQKAS